MTSSRHLLQDTADGIAAVDNHKFNGSTTFFAPGVVPNPNAYCTLVKGSERVSILKCKIFLCHLVSNRLLRCRARLLGAYRSFSRGSFLSQRACVAVPTRCSSFARGARIFTGTLQVCMAFVGFTMFACMPLPCLCRSMR